MDLYGLPQLVLGRRWPRLALKPSSSAVGSQELKRFVSVEELNSFVLAVGGPSL